MGTKILFILLLLGKNQIESSKCDCYNIDNAFEVAKGKYFKKRISKQKILKDFYVKVFEQENVFYFDFKKRNSHYIEFGVNVIKKDCSISNHVETIEEYKKMMETVKIYDYK